MLSWPPWRPHITTEVWTWPQQSIHTASHLKLSSSIHIPSLLVCRAPNQHYLTSSKPLLMQRVHQRTPQSFGPQLSENVHDLIQMVQSWQKTLTLYAIRSIWNHPHPTACPVPRPSTEMLSPSPKRSEQRKGSALSSRRHLRHLSWYVSIEPPWISSTHHWNSGSTFNSRDQDICNAAGRQKAVRPDNRETATIQGVTWALGKCISVVNQWR